MIIFEVDIPSNCKPSNLGFATAIVEKANTYTSDDINLRISNSQSVNAKSILGLLSLRYDANDKLSFQIVGENENYTAPSFERFINKLLQLYTE